MGRHASQVGMSLFHFAFGVEGKAVCQVWQVARIVARLLPPRLPLLAMSLFPALVRLGKLNPCPNTCTCTRATPLLPLVCLSSFQSIDDGKCRKTPQTITISIKIRSIKKSSAAHQSFRDDCNKLPDRSYHNGSCNYQHAAPCIPQKAPRASNHSHSPSSHTRIYPLSRCNICSLFPPWTPVVPTNAKSLVAQCSAVLDALNLPGALTPMRRRLAKLAESSPRQTTRLRSFRKRIRLENRS